MKEGESKEMKYLQERERESEKGKRELKMYGGKFIGISM